ncbi:MAG: glycosyltransferase, partial [Streptomyces sp.]|nr:glycosyltransferase [Streptomyces sp.]
MSLVTSHSPHGQPSLRTVQVLGGGSVASSAHVRSLTAGLVARGVRVTVCAPVEAERAYDFTGVGADHVHVPRSSDPASVAALRAACTDADLVHAHGLHASFRTALALGGRRTPLVVTWHNRAHAEGARAHLLRMLERRAVRAATLVLGTTSDLVDRARRSGARDARLAAVALPGRRPAPDPEDPDRLPPKILAELGALGRPLLL